MIETASPNGAGTSGIASDSVRGVVDAWLPENPEGADAVRAMVARRLASELDRDDLPSYVVPRICGALASVVGEIEGKTPETEIENGKIVDLRELLQPLVTS